jgi:hypothetical protein
VCNQKAVSEIIASLILLFIIAFAGTALYSFGLRQMNQAQSSFDLNTDAEKARVTERFAITAVWWNHNPSPSKLNVTLLNFGLIDLTIDAVYINGYQVETFYSGWNVAVISKQLLSVYFASPVQIASETSYVIRLVTTRGSEDEIYWKA